MFKETLRLQIREFVPGDFDEFAALIEDPQVMRFSLAGPLMREQAKEYFQKKIFDHYQTYGFGYWALVLKEEQKIIGFAGLITQEIDGEKKPELGYRLLPAYWGLGLAYEAVQEISAFAFSQLKLEKIISIIDPENHRSIRLAERMGMQPFKKTRFHQFNVIIYARSNPSNG